MQSNLIDVFVTELQNVQDNSSATTLSDDHADLTSQGMAKIAGALVRKIKNKTEDCPDCYSALTTTVDLPAHTQFFFRDELYIKASDEVC